MNDWEKWTIKQWQLELEKRFSLVEAIGDPVLGYIPIQRIPIIGPVIAGILNIFWSLIENVNLARVLRRFRIWYQHAAPEDQKEMDEWIKKRNSIMIY